MNGRHENVRAILEHSLFSLHVRMKETSLTPLGYAVEGNHIETVAVLLEFGARKGTAVGLNRMPPICTAAAKGYYDLLQFLLDNRCRPTQKDKFGRQPLMLAARNGHLKCASLLLRYGAPWDAQDSSGNTSLQYACAYGWMDMIDLLLRAGADVNMSNSWKMTATNLAMMKHQFGCVKRML